MITTNLWDISGMEMSGNFITSWIEFMQKSKGLWKVKDTRKNG